jgi:hypothetical protein
MDDREPTDLDRAVQQFLARLADLRSVKGEALHAKLRNLHTLRKTLSVQLAALEVDIADAAATVRDVEAARDRLVKQALRYLALHGPVPDYARQSVPNLCRALSSVAHEDYEAIPFTEALDCLDRALCPLGEKATTLEKLRSACEEKWSANKAPFENALLEATALVGTARV